MTSFDKAYNDVAAIVREFELHHGEFLAHTYQESEVRQDYLDKFWTALGWDVGHVFQTNPREREVKIEKSDTAGSTRRVDYAFYLKPDYRNPVFFCEAKKPSRDLNNAEDYFQLVRYGYGASTPVGALTNFDEFHIIDCRYQPHIEKSYPSAQIKVYTYKDYLDKEAFGYIYWIFSREAVEAGKLKEYAKSLPKQQGKGKAKLTAEEAKPVDEAFLTKLEEYRRTLAKAFKKADESLNADVLTEATQKVIDRLVFIRFLEDKYIESDYIVDQIAETRTESGDRVPGSEKPSPRTPVPGTRTPSISAWKSFLNWSKELDVKYNGVVFKPHDIDKPEWHAPDDKIFAELCADISHTHSKYLFTYIPIELLGSIYERFLGKVVVTTPKRADIEDKPEVRKAGGVYYTPKYIVDYIVANTVGRILGGHRVPGTGVREEEIDFISKGENNDKKLSGPSGLADSDGHDRRGIRSDRVVSNQRAIRTSQPDESSGDIGAQQYSRGMGTEFDEGVRPSSLDRIRLADGDRNADDDSDSQKISDTSENREVLGVRFENGTNVESPNAVTRFRSASRTPVPGSRTPLTPKEISKLRFADIACGSGSFLIAVYDTVLHHVEKWYNDNPAEAKKAKCNEIEKGIFALSLKQKQQILLDNIFGVDIDRQAVEVAQLSLFLKLLESESGATAEQLSFERTKILPDLSKNIQCGNSLVEYDISDLFPLTDEEEKRIKPFSFQSAFREIMAGGGFDAIVGNPPYDVLEKERGESSWPHDIFADYAKKKNTLAPALGGKLNLFRFFIVRMISLVKVDGRYGLIVPMALLADISCANTRKYFLMATDQLKADCFPQKDNPNRRVFKEAKLSTCIITGKHLSEPKETSAGIDINVYPWNNFEDAARRSHLKYSEYRLLDPKNEPIPLVSQEQWNVCLKLHTNTQSARLGEIKDFNVTRGEINQTIFRKYINTDSNNVRMLKGVEICQYGFNSKLQQGFREWFDEQQYLKSNNRKDIVEKERIATQRIPGVDERLRVVANLVGSRTYFADSTNSITLTSGSQYDLRYLLGILNCKMIQWRFRLTSSNNNVGTNELESLPIRVIDFSNSKDAELHARMVRLVSQITAETARIATVQRDTDREQLQKKCDYLESQIDLLVYELYGLMAEEIKVIDGN